MDIPWLPPQKSMGRYGKYPGNLVFNGFYGILHVSMGIHILVSRRKIQFLPSHGSSESKETQGNTEKLPYPVVNGGSGSDLWVSIFDRQ